MTTHASVGVREEEAVVVAAVSGQVDLSNAHVVQANVQTAMDDGPGGLVLDLSDVTYLDSAGVQLLFRIVRHGATLGVPTRLVVPDGSLLRRVLDISDLPGAVPVDVTVADAVGALRAAV